LVEAKNHAESLMHSTQKSVVELGDKISPADKAAVESAVADLKSALEGEDAEAIKEKTNVLAQAAMKLGEALYKAQGAGGSASTDGEVPNMEKDDAGDDIVDADFTEVGDDDKKTS
jgi:molecular chaperone DnaK